jgi:hypothetical protein
MHVPTLRAEWPVVRIIVPLVPDLLCADSVQVFPIGDNEKRPAGKRRR